MPFGTVGERDPQPLVGADRTVAYRLAEGREHLPVLGHRWLDAVMRLEKANAWFLAHRYADDPDRWTGNMKKRDELISTCVVCFLRARWQVQDYAGACREATPAQLAEETRCFSVDPRDPKAVWLALMPTPDETIAATGWSCDHGFWPREFGSWRTHGDHED